ncbi:hypothetical protein [Pedobacter nyackensis]|nr:hypothetical protein [Pedobacter nyackensis]
MKLYQTDTSEKAYFILEPNCELEAPVHVAFEDFDMAKAYLNRFRT